MFDWFTNSTAIIIILPVVVFILSMFISGLWMRKRQRRIMFAADMSTLFLIIAVHFFMIVLFGHSFLLYILLFLFTLGIVIVLIAAKKEGEIQFKKIIRGYWRLCFFLFALLYVGLYLYGIIYSLIMML
ncbi:DUF3397 domain-containing protein [Listeria ivanovii]|uniref:DUF3397 domain-containing protein n=1 Tax=Listeria ivanovii subsp. londoniensis TaxID=202752 RepID=A0ABS1G723_LISIV|nr:DUF3397 domain-containing protein [Listeria ivanovii]AIS60445.1 hypothetical protein JL58_10840 [Listeria ivanovii subsp. londoniensis]AIS63270.1 hypothetical protein JL53_11310 [Listeria ivanovii subsp. londoniensis]MBC2255935.1 DUF3397 domain-containing protein [Listeria ivanovii]MBK1962702.1 DUF3397 domain-containing protein [Listeria ivanovii subsp. londoniensis]MBK1967576.1 DUF3397 domain-containing protein [Listeria ivanovii subsp. londoniensis]